MQAIDLHHFVVVLCLVHRCHLSRLEMNRRPVAMSLFVVLSMGCHLAVDGAVLGQMASCLSSDHISNT